MSKKKIMFIDDDTDLLEIMQVLCKVHGYEYMGETRVATALEKIPVLQPDLIVVDLHFVDGFDGTSFLMSYKTRVKTRDYDPPIIVLSGIDISETINFVIELGANGYMNKPFEPTKLMAMINDYLMEQPIYRTSGLERDVAAMF